MTGLQKHELPKEAHAPIEFSEQMPAGLSPELSRAGWHVRGLPTQRSTLL